MSVVVHFRKSLIFEPFFELLEVFGTHLIHLQLLLAKKIYQPAVYYSVSRCFSSRLKIFKRNSDVCLVIWYHSIGGGLYWCAKGQEK